MDPAKVEAMLNEICQTIGGEWLLVGGSLVLLEYDGARATEDIDLVRISHPTYSDVRSQDELFKAAIRLGMDAESVNSAARFFVEQHPEWQNELIELRRGSIGVVYKPSLTLFIALKLRRATENDIADVRAAIAFEGVGAFVEDRFMAMADAPTQAKFKILREKLGLHG